MQILSETIKAADWKSEKHVPVIDAPMGIQKGAIATVTVTLGKEVAHPNTTAHHIAWMALFFQPEGSPVPYEIGRVDFSAHGASANGADQSGVYTLDQAKDQATAEGHNGKKVAALLAPAKRLVIDNFAWQPLAKSLSVFVSPSLLVINQVPVVIGPSVCVSDRIYLEPLLDSQSEDSVIDLPASHRKQIGRVEEEHRDKSLAAPFRSLR